MDVEGEGNNHGSRAQQHADETGNSALHTGAWRPAAAPRAGDDSQGTTTPMAAGEAARVLPRQGSSELRVTEALNLFPFIYRAETSRGGVLKAWHRQRRETWVCEHISNGW